MADRRTAPSAAGGDRATWHRHVQAAHAAARPGDLLLLATEAPRAAARAVALLRAAQRLCEAGHAGLAAEQIGAALAGPLPMLLKRAATALRGRVLAQVPRTTPGRVLLFSGHMVDAPGRAMPRFPPAMVPRAQARIVALLEALHAGPADVAITQGAAGGDLLFAQACFERGVAVQLLLPLPEPEFIARSLLPSAGGEGWRTMYLELRRRLSHPPRVAPEALGPVPPGADLWERCNRWMLLSALASRGGRVHAVLLWDGGGGDGPGGTRHMRDEVQRRGGQVSWIDTRTL
jgi:hypothetical protein